MSNHSSYLILTILLLLAVFFYLVVRYINNPIKPPKPTLFNLPDKIHFERTADDSYGVGSFMLDVVTIGGHGRLKEARFNYEESYISYANNFNSMVDIQASVNNNLNAVGAMTYKILRELDRSRRLLGKPANSSTKNNITPQINTLSTQIYRLKSIADEKGSTGTALIQGTTVGGLAAVGSWTLVSMFGSASTGTAIASLSGIAAHNSILAWFGGGAIAAGGGGMAAGTITLGAIAIIPVVLISSYKTHSSAKELDIKTEKIKVEIPKLISSRKELVEANKLIKQQLNILELQYNKVKMVNKKAYDLIYPYGIASQAKRSIDKLKNQDFYTKQEVEGIEQLLSSINDIYKVFDSKDQRNVSLAMTKTK